MVTVKIILGTTRPNRFGPQIADWLQNVAKENQPADVAFEFVDLADVNLPLLDEPMPPSLGNYANAHTKAWAKIVGSADGFVFITPEYNYTTSAALMNALDTVSAEWNFKPAAFVSYGAGAGGARAVLNLRTICGVLSIFDLRDEINIPYFQQLGKDGKFQPTDAQNESAKKLLASVGTWAEAFKPIREQKQAAAK